MNINHEPEMNGRADAATALAFVRERADEFVDGRLDERAAGLIDTFVVRYPACDHEIRKARLLKSGLRSIDGPPCPGHVVQHVLDTVPARKPAYGFRRFHAAVPALRRVWRPAVAIASVVAIAIMFTINQDTSPGHTQDEVDQAVREVKWTLAYISDIGKQTGVTIRDDVVLSQVVSPINESLKSAFK